MADNSTILEKLDGLVARFEEISTLITDPAVIADQKRYVKLTKEYKDLDDLMKARKNIFSCWATSKRPETSLPMSRTLKCVKWRKRKWTTAKSASRHWKKKSN